MLVCMVEKPWIPWVWFKKSKKNDLSRGKGEQTRRSPSVCKFSWIASETMASIHFLQNFCQDDFNISSAYPRALGGFRCWWQGDKKHLIIFSINPKPFISAQRSVWFFDRSGADLDWFPGGEGTENARGDEREGDPSGSAKRFGPVGWNPIGHGWKTTNVWWKWLVYPTKSVACKQQHKYTQVHR